MLSHPQGQQRTPPDPVVHGLAADRCPTGAAQGHPDLSGGPHRTRHLSGHGRGGQHLLHRRDQRVRLPLELIDTNTGAEQQREPLPDPRAEAGQQPLGRSLGIRGSNHTGNCHTPKDARYPVGVKASRVEKSTGREE